MCSSRCYPEPGAGQSSTWSRSRPPASVFAPSLSLPPSPSPLAIVLQIQVEDRRFSGWLDPRYPIGFWQAALTLTGDVSGGALGIDLLFQTANGPARLNSQMYSVERLGIRSSSFANRDVRVGALNMGGPRNEGFNQEYAFRLEAIAGPDDGALLGADLAFLPWFLGSQRTAGITAALSLSADNINGESYTFEAEGYRWSPRSVLVDGGPQRPPTGIYRA